MGLMSPRFYIYGVGLAILSLSTGCVTGRVHQFHHFADAGTAYVQASQTVLDQAGSAAIDADSLIAISGRDALTRQQRRVRQYILSQRSGAAQGG